jgi:hypothetical protein
MVTACIPEPHILLTVVASTDVGRARRVVPLGGHRRLSETAREHTALVDCLDRLWFYRCSFHGSLDGQRT